MHINKLNEDCLVYIFRNLPIRDKFRIPTVCQKWRNLNKSYFNNVDKIHITKYFMVSTNDEIKFFKGNIIDSASFILEICGVYVSSIEIHHFNERIDYLKLENLILKHCGNLKALVLFDAYNPVQKSLFNDTMNSLLSKLPNITSIALRGLNLLYCRLTNLQNIEELCILNCAFDSLHFDNLKNLKKCRFEVKECLNLIMNTLILCECQNVEDFSFSAMEFDSNKLAEFLSKQNKLNKIDFKSVINDEIVINSLSSNLEIISHIGLNENITFCLSRLQNLKKFSGSIIGDLTDNFIKGISKCKKLENLDLFYWNYKLSEVGESYFAKLENIKYIRITARYKDLTHLLPFLKNCKNLEYIEIPGINAEQTVYAEASRLKYFSFKYKYDIKKIFE